MVVKLTGEEDRVQILFYVSGDNKPIWMQAEEREENKVRMRYS